MSSLALGTPGSFRAQLNGLVLSGAKTATTGLLAEYAREDEVVEHVGERLALVDDADGYVAMVEITAVARCRFDEVSLPHAVAEGEGWESVEDWHRDHRHYWSAQGIAVDDGTEVVCLSFRLVEAAHR